MLSVCQWDAEHFFGVATSLQASRSHVFRHGPSQRWNQLGADIDLVDVCARTSRDCRPRKCTRVELSHDENKRRGEFMLDAASRVEAVHHWHRDVQ